MIGTVRMKPLTSHQRSALHLAARKGGASLADGKIRRQTANLLALRKWVTIVNGVVLITKAGRAELQKPIPEDPDVLLRIRDGLTTSRKDAVLSEPPVTNTATLKVFWHEQAKRREAEAKDGRGHARKLCRTVRNWPISGPCGPVTVRFDPDEIRESDAA
jgi:hypothetical protein